MRRHACTLKYQRAAARSLRPTGQIMQGVGYLNVRYTPVTCVRHEAARPRFEVTRRNYKSLITVYVGPFHPVPPSRPRDQAISAMATVSAFQLPYATQPVHLAGQQGATSTHHHSTIHLRRKGHAIHSLIILVCVVHCSRWPAHFSKRSPHEHIQLSHA